MNAELNNIAEQKKKKRYTTEKRARTKELQPDSQNVFVALSAGCSQKTQHCFHQQHTTPKSAASVNLRNQMLFCRIEHGGQANNNNSSASQKNVRHDNHIS